MELEPQNLDSQHSHNAHAQCASEVFRFETKTTIYWKHWRMPRATSSTWQYGDVFGRLDHTCYFSGAAAFACLWSSSRPCGVAVCPAFCSSCCFLLGSQVLMRAAMTLAMNQSEAFDWNMHARDSKTDTYKLPDWGKMRRDAISHSVGGLRRLPGEPVYGPAAGEPPPARAVTLSMMCQNVR